VGFKEAPPFGRGASLILIEGSDLLSGTNVSGEFSQVFLHKTFEKFVGI
jgi:hypothetical protein